jgi:hypothetical protein
MLSTGALTILIYAALAVVAAAPLILLVLWIRDLKKGMLW